MSIASIKSLSHVQQLGFGLLSIKEITDWKSNRNKPVDGIVNIGPGLYQILVNNKIPLNQLTVKSRLFDYCGGSQNATHSISIESPNSNLCIRLRYDIFEGNYHIVGYTGSIE